MRGFLFHVIDLILNFYLDISRDTGLFVTGNSLGVNPLSPNIHIQILHTDLYTFPLRISWENLIKDHGIFSMMIILLILITLSLDSVWILLGENCCWSLLRLKGLRGWESLFAAFTDNSVHFLWYSFLGNCSAYQHSPRSNP